MKGENVPSPSPTPHAVVVPFPAQGHVNALLHFADLLRARGFFITFVNTEWTEKRILRSSKQFLDRSNFRFLSFSDGLPAEDGRTTQPGEVLASLPKCGAALEEVLRSCGGVPPVTCIVTDSFMSCTVSVSVNMGVPRVVFWPLCAAASITQKYANLLISQGHIPVKVTESRGSEKMICGLPGNIPDLWPSDLISFYREQCESDAIFTAMLYEAQQSNEADYVLINTFEELEGRDAAAALSANGCPSLAIGP
ncbi:hypothetical protein KI387_014667, partial [Taxus chinensis]